jgi:protein-S-isoprenylcysteine O-methyltransferase Ste14
MDFAIRIYLLSGLLLHKGIWEALRFRAGRAQAASKRPSRTKVGFVKLVKLAILGFLIAQTAIPHVFPVLSDPRLLWIPGLAIYTLGLATAITARLQLGKCWTDIESATVLREHRVISKGIYRFIRHPIYVGDLLLLLGLQITLNSWLFLAVPVLATVVVCQAIDEERMLRESLPGYADYCRQTKRFIPFLV